MEGIGRELEQLGRLVGRVPHGAGGVTQGVEVRGGVGGVLSADHRLGRVLGVGQGTALAEELGAEEHLPSLAVSSAAARLDGGDEAPSGGPRGHSAAQDDGPQRCVRVFERGAQLLRDAVDGAQIGSSIGGGRGPDAHDHRRRIAERRERVVAGSKMGAGLLKGPCEAGLRERGTPLAEQGHLDGVDVHADERLATAGEGGGDDRADVAEPEDA